MSRSGPSRGESGRAAARRPRRQRMDRHRHRETCVMRSVSAWQVDSTQEARTLMPVPDEDRPAHRRLPPARARRRGRRGRSARGDVRQHVTSPVTARPRVNPEPAGGRRATSRRPRTSTSPRRRHVTCVKRSDPPGIEQTQERDVASRRRRAGHAARRRAGRVEPRGRVRDCGTEAGSSDDRCTAARARGGIVCTRWSVGSAASSCQRPAAPDGRDWRTSASSGPRPHAVHDRPRSVGSSSTSSRCCWQRIDQGLASGARSDTPPGADGEGVFGTWRRRPLMGVRSCCPAIQRSRKLPDEIAT